MLGISSPQAGRVSGAARDERDPYNFLQFNFARGRIEYAVIAP
jgi:hypothetical protein